MDNVFIGKYGDWLVNWVYFMNNFMYLFFKSFYGGYFMFSLLSFFENNGGLNFFLC